MVEFDQMIEIEGEKSIENRQKKKKIYSCSNLNH